MGICSKVLAAAVIALCVVGCFTPVQPTATPTAMPNIPTTVGDAVDAALGPTSSPIPSPIAEPTATSTLRPTDTPNVATPPSTLVPKRVEPVVPTRRGSTTVVPARTPQPTATRTTAEFASKFWLPRSGTYTRADGEWRYARATLVSASASLSAPDGSSGGPFTLPSKGELVTLPSSADGEVTGHLFMECSEPGDFVAVGVGWPGEIMKTEAAGVVAGVQFDAEGWQYQLWRPENAPTTYLQVPLNEDHEYVRRLANSRKFSLDLGFDDGSVLRMRWNLPGNLSAPSDAVALCNLMR